jgi:hypothetical protein
LNLIFGGVILQKYFKHEIGIGVVKNHVKNIDPDCKRRYIIITINRGDQGKKLFKEFNPKNGHVLNQYTRQANNF